MKKVFVLILIIGVVYFGYCLDEWNVYKSKGDKFNQGKVTWYSDWWEPENQTGNQGLELKLVRTIYKTDDYGEWLLLVMSCSKTDLGLSDAKLFFVYDSTVRYLKSGHEERYDEDGWIFEVVGYRVIDMELGFLSHWGGSLRVFGSGSQYWDIDLSKDDQKKIAKFLKESK